MEDLSEAQVDTLLFAHTRDASSDGRGTRLDLDLTGIYPELKPGDWRKFSPRMKRLLMKPIRGGMVQTANFNAAGLTTSITTYSIGDMLGSEVTWTGMATAAGRSASILSATMLDYAAVIGAVDLLFFTAASTPAADNAANSWSDANMLLCGNNGATVSFGTPVASALNSKAVVPQVGQTYTTTTTTSMFGNAITRTANGVFGAATDLKYSAAILLD